MKAYRLLTIVIALLVWAKMPAQAQAPAKSRVVLTVDKNEFFLGENALVHYCFENISPEPIKTSYGGDYRGASRSLRFKVTATDTAGTVMPDPDPSGFSMGGIGGFPQILPGDRWCQSLPLMRYARIDSPGTYVVRVVHDLGLPAGEAPEGRITVSFLAPSDAQAEQVVTAMMALPRDGGTSMGRLSKPYADFSALRYGVYLRPLLRRAEAGDTIALAAIGSIPTPEATRALIAMLADKNPATMRIAARTLTRRLPDPALDGTLKPRGPFADPTESVRKYLIDIGWRDEFAPDIRLAATKLLEATAIEDIVLGAFMLEAVGGPEMAPALSAALTRAIENTLTLPLETYVYPRPRGSAQELMRAADILVRRGYLPNTPGETPGGMALWLVAFGNGARPTGWEEYVSRALAHRIPYIREVAIERLPADVIPAFLPAIRTNLASTNADVQVAACDLVYRTKLNTLHADVSNTLRTAKEEWAVRSCGNALYAIGANFERLDTFAVRLSEPDMTDMLLEMLLGLFESHGSTGCCKTDQGRALSVRWRAFLAARRADIEAERTISLDDPSVPVDLVPPGITLHRSGKPDWPPK